MMITLSILYIIGLLISKEFRTGFFNMVGAIVVFTPLISFGVIYSVVHAFYMAIKKRKIQLLGHYIWRLIDGTYTVLGDMMKYGIAYRLDELGNVFGESFEDSITTEETTPFGEKQTTISASIGFLEYHNLPMFKFGKFVSKLLNFAFRQKYHTIGSWELKLAKKELEDKNLHGNLNK